METCIFMIQDIKKADEQLESTAYSEKNTSSVPLCSLNSIKSDFTDKSEESTQHKEVMFQLSANFIMFSNEF